MVHPVWRVTVAGSMYRHWVGLMGGFVEYNRVKLIRLGFKNGQSLLFANTEVQPATPDDFLKEPVRN